MKEKILSFAATSHTGEGGMAVTLYTKYFKYLGNTE